MDLSHGVDLPVGGRSDEGVAGAGQHVIARIEDFVTRVLEGTTARLFHVKLQPVQIAKRVIRAMEANQTVSLNRTFAPNSYVVSLSGPDYEQFERFKRSLERDLAEAVLAGARERTLTLTSFPRVEIDRSEAVATGEVRVRCALVDETGEEMPEDHPALRELASGHTQILDRDKLLAVQPRGPKASLEMSGEGRRVPVGAGTISIGRAPDNDIVLDDRRVSRRHAEVRLRLGKHTLYDLGSTNGTFVNGKKVNEIALSEGDRITFGAATLIYHAEE
ncbi:MAG: DUF2662 domain-containing protein [Chloroflexi bacterium]|nr:MAG: DUF2662 domain-containing protein [Chloroflexota bacterium]